MVSIVVDTETTGLGHRANPPRDDAIVQIGMAWREKGKVKTWSEHCNPGEKYYTKGRAAVAFEINCIPLETVQSARPVKAVAAEFWRKVDAIDDKQREPSRLFAYNRVFDEGFLCQKPWSVPQNRWGDCIMRRAAQKLTGTDYLKLERAAGLMQIPWPGKRAHDAAIDSHAALLVHEQLSGVK